MEVSLGLEANFAENDIFIFLSLVKIFLTFREYLLIVLSLKQYPLSSTTNLLIMMPILWKTFCNV